MRGGSSSSHRLTTMRLRDEPSTNEEDNVDSQENETLDSEQDQQQEDNNVPLPQEQPQEEFNLMGRTRVTVVADRIQPSEPCSRRISKIFKLKLDEQGASYKLVSSDTKKFYFEEFKKHFVWDAAINALVEKAFDIKAKTRYSDFITQIKNKEKPSYVSQATWDEWNRRWKSPEIDAVSKRNSKNRICGKENEAAPSTHVCGSVTHATTERRLEEQTQKPPTGYQLFVHSHTLGHDGQHFVSDKSRDVNERMLALMEERRAAGVADIDEDQLFFEVVGGSKRRRIYGIGQADFIHYPEASSSSSSVNQVDIEDQVTQKVSELHLTLESEIREHVTAEIREHVTAEIRESFEERLAEQNRVLVKMQEQMAEFFHQPKDKSDGAS